MSEFNNLKNFCQFISTGANQLIEEYGNAEACRLFEEHLFNLMIEADVDEAAAARLSVELTMITFNRDLIETSN